MWSKIIIYKLTGIKFKTFSSTKIIGIGFQYLSTKILIDQISSFNNFLQQMSVE